MSSYQPTIIAPFSTGLQVDLEGWISPPDSFREINNLHVKHGNLEKRSGTLLYGILEAPNAVATITNITKANPGEVTTSAPHNFNTNDVVSIAGVEGMTAVNGRKFTITVTSPTTFTIGIDTSTFAAYSTGGFVSTLAATSRVMGIATYIDSLNEKVVLAWDTQYTYVYNGLSNKFVPINSSPIFDSSKYDFVQSVNFETTIGSSDVYGAKLFFTNGQSYDGSTDGIYYYPGVDSGGNVFPYSTGLLRPDVDNAGTKLNGAKFLFSLRGRLVALYTYEGSQTFPQRARWTKIKDASQWNSIQNVEAGYDDAATGEQIISAQAVQNAIIVFFTNSVWILLATGQTRPAFVWKRLNAFRSCDGKMASVSYDRYGVSLGTRGIFATDGSQTSRMDEGITTFSDNYINTDEFNLVFSLRDYANKRWWTLYPSRESSENDQALIYDDESKAYTTYSIDLTCLGYGYNSADLTWDMFDGVTYPEKTWDEFDEDETFYSAFFQGGGEIFLGGDVNSKIYELNVSSSADDTQVTFETASWNPYIAEGASCQLGYVDIYAETDRKAQGEIQFFTNSEDTPYRTEVIDFVPPLDFVAPIAGIVPGNPSVITSYNHGLSDGDQIYIYAVLGITNINGGPYTVSNSTTNTFEIAELVVGTPPSGTLTPNTTAAIYRKPWYRSKVWKRVYAGGIGNEHKMKFVEKPSDGDILIQAFKPYFKKTENRSIN